MRQNTIQQIREILFMILVVLLCFECKFHLFSISTIPSRSMCDTLKINDRLFVTKYHKGQKLQRGDIITFNETESDALYIKRIIGLPGEEVTVREGTVKIDGVELNEPYVKSMLRNDGDGTFQVPENSYFVMGDNRDNSNDSRYWNNPYVPVENVQGIARFIFWPISRRSIL